jgi:signal peptidase I
MFARTSIEWMARPQVAPSVRLAAPSHERVAATIWLLVALACLSAAWWLIAPPALRGSTSFVTVDGTSMLPSLQRDDLVALRRSRSYRVGEVVAYRSALLHRVVLHRIVRIQGGRYTFKGDNNTFLDPEHPTEAQLVGRLSVRIPAAGRIVPLMHVPWIVGALAALLVLSVGLGGGSARPADVDPSRLS